ncbi:MAG: hypothetical protein H7263_03440, partial [Candidatus Sericytochromatia bacterium]|nr:hypothetical protein [Candidatus Sericytochromatia bacterium]
ILKDMGILDQKNIPIKIYGFDINTNFLEMARKSIYSSWSFRGMDEKYKKYFDFISHNNYSINNEIKKIVNFVHFNIKEDLFIPNLTSLYGVPDIILCRNTLMYFEKSEVHKIVSRLSELIANGGCIIPAAQELNIFKSDKLQINQINKTFIFTKQKISSSLSASKPDALKTNKTQAKTKNISIFAKDKIKSDKKINESIKTTKSNNLEFIYNNFEDLNKNSDFYLLKALELTSSNEFELALKLCDKILAYNNNESIAYYIKSFIYFINDELDKSITYIEKALTLNTISALFHYSYSNILLKKEFSEKVIYHLKKAKSLVEKEDDRVLEITKMTKNDLEECIDIALNNLEVIE